MPNFAALALAVNSCKAKCFVICISLILFACRVRFRSLARDSYGRVPRVDVLGLGVDYSLRGTRLHTKCNAHAGDDTRKNRDNDFVNLLLFHYRIISSQTER